jgi:two-component system, NtrC family, sensor kinase
MTLRRTLMVAMALLALLATAILGVVGALTISRTVIQEAQSRVTKDLSVLRSQYHNEMQVLALRLEHRARGLRPDSPGLAEGLQEIRRDLGFTVLNLCDPEGRPLMGTHPPGAGPLPIERDPVLRRALEGRPAWGTFRLDAERLLAEGGAPLQRAMAVYPPVPSSGTSPETPAATEEAPAATEETPAAAEETPAATEEALFRWFAQPLLDERGRVAALLYGGRALNYDYEFVDNLRDLLFGREEFRGKPVGTVTIFLDGVRVATNVVGPGRLRAIGTTVSESVRRQVLEGGQVWSDRARVVDDWYITGYEPLTTPDGEIVGMLYVGLLEAPYLQMRMALMGRLLLPAGLVGLLAIGLSLVIAGRMTRPVQDLSRAADRLAEGEWDQPLAVSSGYAEINHLSDAFHRMQAAIADRDGQLRRQHAELAETNEKLNRSNRNYMKTLGFVTHELKAPMAAVQSMIDVLLADLYGELPEKARHPLTRIRRNCEDLQGMVKNYLDLSRAERGELMASPETIDLRDEVLDPCVAMAEPLFESRAMTLETEYPVESLEVEADPELLRIALSNYLSNAAKYGREGGTARLRVEVEEGNLVLSVWNEGQGFAPEDREKLFAQFSRIRNKSTADKRGSGLGLFLARQIAEQHGGRVWAESEPGSWAAFHLAIPIEGAVVEGLVEEGATPSKEQ